MLYLQNYEIDKFDNEISLLGISLLGSGIN